MATGKCVYAVVVNGKEVLVEAGNQAQAVRTATAPLVSSCRPLKGSELLDRIKGGASVLEPGKKGGVGGSWMVPGSESGGEGEDTAAGGAGSEDTAGGSGKE